MGSVWVANAAELPGFHAARRTTRPRKPLFHGLSRIRPHQPDGQRTIPKPCVAGSIPARGAVEPLLDRLYGATIDPKPPFGTSLVGRIFPIALSRTPWRTAWSTVATTGLRVRDFVETRIHALETDGRKVSTPPVVLQHHEAAVARVHAPSRLPASTPSLSQSEGSGARDLQYDGHGIPAIITGSGGLSR